MRLDTRQVWLVFCGIVTACSGGSGTTMIVDAAGGARADARPVGSCGDVATFEDGLSPSTQVHVAENGNDNSGDGSSGNPYASIERAASGVAPGTAVVVHAGTYAGGGFLSGLRGTAAAPIWIGGAQGEATPVINGGNNALQLSQVSYLIVHDLEIAGSTNNGINCDDGGDFADETATHHVIFRNLFIHNIGGTGNQDCLKMSGVNDYFVLNSEMAFCGGGMSGSAIDHVGCHRGVVAFNTFRDGSGNAVQTKGGSEDIEIYANTFTNSGERALNMGGSTGLQFFRPPVTGSNDAEARNIRAISNIIEGSPAAIAFVGCVGCLASHNTIIDPTRWVVRILQETASSGGFEQARDGVFSNNLINFDSSLLSTTVNVGADTAPDTFVFANNLWYAHDNPGASAPSLPTPETGGVVGSDPAFTTGYRIDGNSPAAGAGRAKASVRGDFDGNCYGMPPSIGAFETP